MAVEVARAGRDWLALREPADARARSQELVTVLREGLPTGGLVVHDLGGGTGSTARWLAPRLVGAQRWVLHDRDAELLALAGRMPAPRSADGRPVVLETRCDDVTRLPADELAGASLITASALLDMFTRAELERFVSTCAAAGCPVLLTLSVVGRVRLDPADDLDARVVAAFNDHQRRTLAHGRLLGPAAAEAAAGAFADAGLEVLQRPSPWRLGRDEAALATEWFAGWLGAAVEQDPGLAGPATAYAVRCRSQLAAGSLAVTVEHLDLLALPRR
jgi:hypothetical protein